MSITTPINNTSYTMPANIIFSATASETNGTISEVTYYNGSTLVGTSTSSPYRIIWVGVPSGNYSFTATATDSNGVSTTSTAVSVTVVTNSIPTAPTLNTATAGDTQVALSWTASTGATSYSVKYGTASGVYGTPVVVGNLTSYTVTGLTNGMTYYFAVTASNAGGTSLNSNQLSAVPKAASPIAPVLNTATAGNAQVALGWGTVTGATSYSVKYGTASGVYGAPVVVGNLTSYTVT